ncbi:hypothetical protein HanPSC8_Chr05g0219921 [Helianthus annuus]|nr:hypothetical protein HanPSC8_Chr05g0219921 [Helianthus annuus]
MYVYIIYISSIGITSTIFLCFSCNSSPFIHLLLSLVFEIYGFGSSIQVLRFPLYR